MSDSRLRRVNKEILDCAKDRTSGIEIKMVNNSPTHLIGTFQGPDETPYAGGIYEVDIVIPDTYPFAPVKMKFITKVYHPNVSSQSGAICLDILKDAWSPVLTLKSTMISLQSLLTDPKPDDPQDAEVAKHLLNDPKSFAETAKYWAQAYAGAPGDSSADKGKSAAGSKGVSSSLNGATAKPKPASAAQMAGLEETAVKKFMDMGFSEAAVVDVLKRLNYRGANKAKVSDNEVVEALLR